MNPLHFTDQGGKLIVLTGIDGSGKTLQTKLLSERLIANGYAVETIDYPRYHETFFADLAAKYLRGEFGKLRDVSPYLAATLFAGDRFETRDTLRGWLNEGKIVLANRYVADNIAHQGARAVSAEKIEQFAKWVEHLEHDVYELPRADVNILLSVPTAAAYKLIAAKEKRAYLDGKERDIHEADYAYLDATSTVFHRLALRHDWRIIECADSEGEVLEALTISGRVWDCARAFLDNCGAAPTHGPTWRKMVKEHSKVFVDKRSGEVSFTSGGFRYTFRPANQTVPESGRQATGISESAQETSCIGGTRWWHVQLIIAYILALLSSCGILFLLPH